MEITEEKLREKIGNGEKVMVDFWAEFCGPCKFMKPTFDKVSDELMSENYGVELYTFNVQNNKDFALELGIRAVPTIKSFSDGKEVDSQLGIQTEEQIRNLAKQLTLNG